VSRTSRLEIIQNLKERLQQVERSTRPAPVLTTGCALDRLLPGEGWAGGTLVEWLGEGEGSGAATLALAVTADLLRHGGALVVVDAGREFYPPATAIPPDRTVVVQPRDAGDALWALEQALRSRAAAVTLGRVGPAPDRVFRRLQLAAEAGGGLGFLLRPADCRAEPSRAGARLWVEASPGPRRPTGWRLRAVVLHRRGGAAGAAVELELSHETNLVRPTTPLARPALPTRAAGA
jgi:protein ImuA